MPDHQATVVAGSIELGCVRIVQKTRDGLSSSSSNQSGPESLPWALCPKWIKLRSLRTEMASRGKHPATCDLSLPFWALLLSPASALSLLELQDKP